MVLSVFTDGDELQIQPVLGIHQQPIFRPSVLVGNESFTGWVKFHTGHIPSDELFEALCIRAIGDPPKNKQREIREHLQDIVGPRVLKQSLEIHLNPRWNSTDQPQVFTCRFAHNGIDLRLPIFNRIGLPRGQAVALQILRDVMGHNAAQPAQWHPS